MPSPLGALDLHAGVGRGLPDLIDGDGGPEPGVVLLALGRPAERDLELLLGARRPRGWCTLWSFETWKAAQPPGAQDAAHLADVAERHLGVGDVLEDDVGEEAVGDARRRPRSSSLPSPRIHSTLVELRVLGPRLLEHLGRDVDGADAGAALRHRPRHPADAAADLDDASVGLICDTQRAEHRVDIVRPARPERVGVGLACRRASC